MDSLKQMRQFTRDYPSLQGLRALPLAFFFFVIALQRVALVPWLGREGDLSFTLPLLVLVILLYGWIGRYYERLFGKVHPLRTGSNSLGFNLALIAGAVGAFLLENWLYRSGANIPISIAMLVLGTIFLGTGLAFRRLYYTLAGGVMALAAFSPLLAGTGVDDRVYGSLGILHLFVLGGVMLMVSLLDHLRLVRAFRSVGEIAGSHDA